MKSYKYVTIHTLVLVEVSFTMFDKLKKDTNAYSPLMGIVTLLIGVIVVIAVGGVVLDKINSSTANTSSAFWISNLGTQWTLVVGLVLIAVLALVGFFIIRMFGGGAE